MKNWCHPTAEASFAEELALIQANKPGTSGSNSMGAGLGATYVTKYTFTLRPRVGALCNTPTEPAEGYPANTLTFVTACGLERTEVTTWSCASSTCIDWLASLPSNPSVAVVPDENMYANLRGVCRNGALYTTTEATGLTNFAGCRNVEDIDRYGQAPVCPAKAVTGNPIYPMTGAKKEVVGTGFGLAGRELTLTYNSLSRPSDQLWSSNFHVSMGVTTLSDGTMTITATRESNRPSAYRVVFSSGGNASVCGDALPAKTTSVNKVGSELQLKDEVTKSVETYTLGGQLTAVKDAFGKVLTPTFSDANTLATVAPAPGYLLRLTDNTGRYIDFTYVLQTGKPVATGGLIKTITNSQGQTITVGYDASWNLSSLTWPDGKVKAFVYEDPVNPWALTGVIDENSSRFATWTYAPTGHATSSQHAVGVEKSTVTYPAGLSTFGTEKITEEVRGNTLCRFHDHPGGMGSVGIEDANGATSTLTIDVSMGYAQLSGSSQPAGSGCAASNKASTFDSRGNIASQDDFTGMRTCYAYNAKNQETTRIEGLANTVACSSVLPISATLPTGARRYTTTWDPNWKSPVQLTQPGSVSTMVYHGQPDPKNDNTIANCSPATALPNGAPLNLLCKSVTEKASGVAFDNPVGTANDPNVDKVVLLLHGEDGDGAPVPSDSSNYSMVPSKLMTSPRVTIAQGKFGASGLDLRNGGYGYGPANSFKFTGDFTIEAFFKTPSTSSASAARSIFGWGNDPSTQPAGAVYLDGQGNLSAYWLSPTQNTLGTISNPVTANVWHHVALSRINGSWVMHLDGVQQGSAVIDASNYAFSLGYFTVGRADYFRTVYGFDGYVDEVRVSNGVSRYPLGNFTPPTAAFPDPLSLNPSAPKVADANYAKDILLIHADDIDGSKTLVDNSPLANTTGILTRNAVISAAKSKFGGSSIFIPASTDYGDAGVVTGDYTLAGDFTVEFWMNPSSIASGIIPFQIGIGTDANWAQFVFNSGAAYIATKTQVGGNACTFAGLGGFPDAAYANVWIHVAFVRVGGSITSYINGSNNGTCALTGTIGGSTKVFIGRAGANFAAYYDDIRITKGLGRYTAAFIPSPYAAPNVAVLTPDASTIVNQYTYDANGRILTAKDSLNATTTYAYYPSTAFTGVDPVAIGHTVGDLQTITDPKGFVTTFNSYDKSGRILQMTDPKGIVTDMTYTPRGWIKTVTVTPPGGTARVTTYNYDFVGQVTGVLMPDGTSVGYTYDAAHRLIGATDARGNSVTYTLDNVGNRIAEQLKDPGGVLQRTMSRSFDALNRVQQLQLQ
jgi:YD repeat-containing protein